MIRSGIRFCERKVGHLKAYDTVPGFNEKVESMGLHYDSGFWGWGKYSASEYQSSLEGVVQFSSSTDRIVEQSIEISMIIVCAPNDYFGSGYSTRIKDFVARNLGVDSIKYLGLTYSGCTTLLQAIELARLHNSLGYENVLVLSQENDSSDINRVQQHALFSDYSLALIISSDISKCNIEIINSTSSFNTTAGSDTNLQSLISSEKKNIESILDGGDISKIDKYFGLNIYEPILRMRTRSIGLSDGQCFTDNIRKLGHCHGADPIFNMYSFLENSDRVGGDYILSASSEGQSVVMHVRAINA